VPVYSRPRDGRPVTGEAAVRTAPPSGGGGGGSIIYYPYYPWGYWGGGYGFGLGYLFFDPFYCNWGYAYDCGYGYGGGMGYGGGGGGGYAVSSERSERKEQGSLRLKIEPRDAEVFVDGYYVGVVDSYDGAFQKLELDAGNHKIELKANGFEPLEFDVVVPPGETVTYKGGLKRVK
jgi:hypothetical protein